MDAVLPTGLTLADEPASGVPNFLHSPPVPSGGQQGLVRAPSPMPRASSHALIETFAPMPLHLVAGQGARVTDAGGREYWDFYGGHAVALLGHAHPDVTQAISRQAATLAFYSNAAPLDVRSEAAERLAEFAPAPLKRVFFCNSGTEANEHALQIAIRKTGRRRIAALTGAFHGRTLLSVSATADSKLHQPLDGLLAPTIRLRPNEIEDLEQLTELVAAVIVEPIQSLAGVIELSASYLRALRRRCNEIGALLIFDEVQTGMGRLGRPLAAGQHGVTPDLVTLAKGIANGIPMGAVLTTPEIADGIKPGAMGSTFGGGPIACAAMLAVLHALQRDQLVRRAVELGRLMHEKLKVGPVHAVLGHGCLIGLCIQGSAKALQSALLERGFIVGTSGAADVVRLLPPLNLPFEAVDELRTALSGLAQGSETIDRLDLS